MPVTLYLRSRHVLVALLVMAALGTVSALAGGRLLTLLAEDDGSVMPYRYVLTMLMAALAVASLASPVPQTDMGDTGPLARARAVHLGGLLVAGVALCGLAETAADSGQAWETMRSYVFWYGLALVSGALSREALAWMLPTVALFPLVWWGSATGTPEAWNWATAPADRWLSWGMSIAALAAGLLCLGLVAALRRPPVT